MALSTDFNVDPYYDDYDETKNFHRVLFKPGYAVQAREVTQLQTILQKQIERHGEHLFKNGSIVLGCELNYDNEAKSLKLETQYSGADVSVSSFANTIINGGTSNARGRIVSTEAGTASEQPTLMFHYMNNNTFQDGETITIVGSSTSANTISAAGVSGLADAVANSSVCSINSGVFYVGGFFVMLDAQTLTLEKYTSTPSYRVGIQVTETITTSDGDGSLLDPAQGAYNYAAQGANRYTLTLSLSKKAFSAADPVEAAADENFYQLLKVSSGQKLQEVKYPVYSELEKVLARRTSDESGDYTVIPFNLQKVAHQGITGTTANSGTGLASRLTGAGTLFQKELSIGDIVYLSGATTTTATVDTIISNTVVTLDGSLATDTSGQSIHFENKYSAGLDPGKAYVKGYEYENISTKYVTVDKGRDTANVSTFGLNTSFGNKLHVERANGYFDVSAHQILDLHSVLSANVVTGTDTVDTIHGTTNLTNQSRTKVGTARVRDMDWYTGSGNDANGSHYHSDYIMYLYDVRSSNNKTGVVGDTISYLGSAGELYSSEDVYANSTASTFAMQTDIVKIGTSTTSHVNSTFYRIGDGSTSNTTHFAKLAQIDNAYNGATVKITTPVLNKMIAIDSVVDGNFNIALENPSSTIYNVSGDGVILLEEQTSANGVANVTYTRNVVSSFGNSTVTSLQLDSNMSNRTYFSANTTGGPISGECSTFDISFQLKDVKSVSVASQDATLALWRVANADVHKRSKVGENPNANAILKTTHLNTLIYPLPDSPLANTRNFSYTYKYSTSGETLANGQITITPTDSGAFGIAGSPITATQADENFLVVITKSRSDATSDSHTAVSNGQYLSFANTDGESRSIAVSSGSAVIQTRCTSAVNVAVTYTATKTTAGNIRTKTITQGNGNVAYNVTTIGGSPSANTLNTHKGVGQYFVDAPTRTVGEKIELPVTDVFNIVKIVDSGSLSIDISNTMLSATANNITSAYALDTGMRDNYYGHSSVYLKPGYSPPKGKIVIIFDRFAHAGKGYFTVSSYPITGSDREYNNGADTFGYGNVPTYTSPTTGESFKLSDCVDFRPYIAENTNDGTTAVSYDIATSTDAITPGSILIPDSDTTSTLDYSYYLPRIDKLTLTRDRQFEIIKGKANADPIAPPDDEDSMTLYTLKIPAYTFALTDIESRYIDNKRFTMRDIGKLEKRIERLEYFTSLNILEKETASTDITSDGSKDSLFNSTGSRFKNGILVDPFAGHSVGDVTLDDYNASIHFATKQLRPPFFYDNFRFSYDSSTSNNTVKTGDLVTLPYTNTVFIEQPLTSGTAAPNPFNIVNFIGSMKLDPPSDTWFDDTTRPDVTTNLEGHHDNWTLSSSEGRVGFGAQWDDWTVNWTGKQINPEPNTAVANSGSVATNTRSTKLISQNKSKFGIQSDDPVESIVKTVGNRKLDMSVVPYVRSQRVSFSAKGLKPLANVFVWIGSTDMNANTEPAKKLTLAGANGAFKDGEEIKDSANNRGIIRLSSNTVSNVASLWITDITGNSSATSGSPVTLQNNRISNSGIGFADANVVTGLTSSSNGTIGTAEANTRGIVENSVSRMQTNDYGEIAGDIDIPAGIFRTGDRIIRITDQANNELASTTTVAESTFKAKGLLQNREKLLISTREPILRRESIGDEEIVTDTTSRQTTQTNWINPMAQSIFIDPSTYPMGMFLRDITLWFSDKDTWLPVTVQIRPMVNGFPSSSIVLPFSEVTMKPDEIQTSSVANAASSNTTTHTTFTFESPVYLTPDEYAIVITSNSPEYKLYTGGIGQDSTGTTRKISKQPFVGSYFEPQNSGEWKANPSVMLMFRSNRYNFTGTGGSNNYAYFISHANGAAGNTANVEYQTFKTTTSTIQFSNTTSDFTYNSYDTANTAQGFAAFSPDQSINLTGTHQMTMNTNGMFLINCTMSTSNSHISPVIDLDRMSVITIENNVDDAGIAANDIVVTTVGGGYTNVAPSAFTAAITAPDRTAGVTANANVHIEVTLSPTGTIESGNSNYTVDTTNSGQFVIGEGVIVVANNAGGTIVSDPAATDNAAAGIVTHQTYINGNTLANVSTITIKTSANCYGVFANGCCIQSNELAQDADHTNSGFTANHSNTFIKLGTVAGAVSNVVPVLANGLISMAGSGYLTTPTVTISDPNVSGQADAAVATIVGENSTSGGNINAKYISRRVTLEDGFDASDIKVILNAYKPLGTDLHLYYKVKAEDDQTDFDDKSYVLMNQETDASIVSGSSEDVKEFVYKTVNEKITYSSGNVEYDKFRTFAVKMVLTSNNAVTVPKVRDMRVIALD